MRNIALGLLLIFNIQILISCTKSSQENNTKMEEGETTIEGLAKNAKDGAVVVSSDQTVYYIDKLQYWDEFFEGKKIKVTGYLVTDSTKNEDIVNDKGEYKTGIPGDKKLLIEAAWEIIQ